MNILHEVEANLNSELGGMRIYNRKVSRNALVDKEGRIKNTHFILGMGVNGKILASQAKPYHMF